MVVTGDEVGRLVIVSAAAEKHELIAKVIKEIDDAQAVGDITVKVYRLQNAEAASVATALIGAVDRNVASVAGGAPGGGRRGGAGGGGGAGAQLSITADRSSNSLVVRASATDHEKIAKLIRELDVAPNEQFAIRLIPLNNADATNVAQVLTRVFTGAEARAGGARGGTGAAGQTGPRTAIVIEADRDARTIMVRADDPTFEKIKALAMQLDASSVIGQATATVVPLKFAQATSVAPVLSQAFQSPRAFRGQFNPDELVTIIAEPASNSLVVSANAPNLEKVKALLAKLDTDVAGGIRTELLILKNAKATDVAPVLAKMSQTTPGAAGGGGMRFGRFGGGGDVGGQGGVSVSADAGSNGLVITGPSTEVDKVMKMAKELDVATGESIVKMYPLKNADVKTAVQALQDIFGSGTGGGPGPRLGGGRGGAGAVGVAASVTITGDEAGRLVIVSAPQAKQELVAKVIKELDEADGGGEVTVKIYRLVNADAQGVATALSATVERTSTGGGGLRGGAAGAAGGQIRISADRSSNCIVVRANKEDHDRIAKLVTELDVAPSEQFAVRLIPLTNADATVVAQVLSRVFAGTTTTAAGGGRGVAAGAGATGLRTPVVIEADREARMLMVRADDPTFEKIKTLARELDTASPVGQATPTVIALKFAQAAAVAPAIGQAFGAGARGAGRAATANPDDMVTVVAEPMSNSLIVTANAQNLVKVNALLAKLDTEVAGGMRTELLLLKNAKAPDVAPVLAKMALSTGPVAAGGRGALGATGGIGAVNVSADAGSNGLVISGPSADVDKVIKMALDLDKATGESIVKMYPLKNADVASTVQALQDLFGSAARGAMGARGATKGQADLSNITVTGDPAGRQVIVLAPAEKQELVAKVITEMDLAQSVDEVTVKIYHLINSDAVSVAPALSATVERAPGATAAGRGVGATALTGQIRISADRSSNSIIVRAGKEDHERIAKLIVDLDVAPTEQFAVRLIQLNTADATNVAAVLTRIFTGQSSTAAAGAARGAGASGPRQAVVIEADRDSHMLMVRADDTTFEKIKALAEKMDTGSKGQAMPTVIALKFAQAAGVAPTLQAAFAARSTVAGRGGVPANPDDMVTVVAEPMSNSLIVTANTQNLEKFNALLAQLDTQIAGGIRTELIILKNAKAVDVAPVLTRMVQTAASGGKGAAAAAAVSISAETGSNGLVVSGPSSEVEKVMKMVDDIDQASIGTLSSVYVVALKNGDATSVAQMVHDLYTQQQQAALRDKKSIDPLAVTSDLRSNAIVLATTKQMYEQVTLWVNQIESMQPARGSVRIISLQNADPTDLNNAIRQIFPSGTGTPTIPLRRGPNGAVGATGAAGAPTGGTTSGKVDATVLPAQRSVLISASDEDFETIKKLAEAMDAAAADAKRQVKVFPLKHGNNTRIALALTNMYRAGAQRLGPTTGTVDDSVTVTALPDTNAVVVSATKTRMEEVAHLIEELDRVEIAPQLEYHIYPLQNATPTKLLPQITLMVAQLRMTRPDEPIGVQADERTRSIIITARGPMYEQVSKIIETLDKAPSFAQVEVLIVPLKRADATRLALVLNDMLKPSLTGQATPEAVALQEQVRLLRVQGREGEKVPELDLTKPIKITADPNVPSVQGSNSLVITSTPDNLKAMKAIVEMLDAVPLAEGVKVRIVHLLNADAASVEVILKDIFTQGQKLAGRPKTSVDGKAQPDTVSGKALVYQFNVSADTRTNSLIMSGIEESLALADLVVKDLDRDSGKIVTEVRLFRLKFADAVKMVPMLQAVFAEAGGTGGGAAAAGAGTAAIEGLRTQVTRLRTVLEKEAGHTTEIPKTRAAFTIQADPATSIVIIAARSDVMPLVADVIDKMDVPGAGAMNVVRIFPLINADATRLKTIIDGLYTGPNATLVRPEDKPITGVDIRTNALVISASDKTFIMIDTLLKNLDAKQPIDLRDIRLVMLKNADATTLAPALQKMMDARVQRLTTLGQADAEALRVIITPDPRSNGLMVGGSAEGFEIVKTLAEQLDAAGPAIIGEIQIMPLTHGNAGAVASTLTNFFNQRYLAARTPDVQRQKPIVLADLRVNALLVAANADDTKVLKGLLEKLDSPNQNPSVQLVVIPLKNNDSGVVGPMVQRLFAARLQSMLVPGQTPEPTDRVDLQTDALSNALIVSASKENLELIRGLLEKVDTLPLEESGIVRMYALQNSDAQRVATMLQNLVTQGLYKPGMLASQNDPILKAREKVSIIADVRTNVIVVSASKENFAVLEEIIKKIDSTEDFTMLGDVRLFILKNADSTRLAPTLQQLFTAKRAAEQAAGDTGRSLPVSVFADPRTNALLVVGSKESFNTIEAMVRELDTDQVLASNEFRIFYLKQATAQIVQPTLTQLFAQRVVRGGQKDAVTIVPELRTNALIVSANPEDMKLAESLINRLDAEPDRPGTTVQVFALIRADATQVATSINNLYKTPGAQAAGAPQVVVSVDERTNALIISAGDSDQKRIKDLVHTLDTDTVPRVTEIRVFTLQNADATELATLLTAALTNKPKPMTTQSPNRETVLQFITKTKDGQQLVASALQEGVLITPDRRTNSLVISAPTEAMPLLDSIVKAMDSATPRMAEIRVYTLQNADARQMATVLLQLFKLQATAGVTGGTAGKQAIRYTLNVPDASGEKPPAATIGSAEDAALSVTVDVRTNSLLVGGTKHYVELAGKVIQDLDANSISDRMTEIYRLRNAQATDIEAALASFLNQERQLLTQAMGTGGSAGGGTAQYILDREVAIVSEPVTNTLLLSASPRYFDVISQMIAELDQPPPQVLIQVLLVEMTINDSTDFGAEWNFNDQIGSTKVSLGPSLGLQGTNGAIAGTPPVGFTVSATGGNIQYWLRALQSQGRVEVLSRPQILASDNQKATINIGQRVPFITNTRYGDTTNNVINTIQYQQIGIILNVTPRINPDGFVKLVVSPEVSSIDTKTSNVYVTPGVPAVIINSRSADTTVTVQDGHTIVIGGLITTSDENTESKVPILGDIPILGWLFKNTRVAKVRTELLIILTPTVIRNAREADDETMAQMRRLNLLRDAKHDTMQKSLFKVLNAESQGADEDAAGKPAEKAAPKNGTRVAPIVPELDLGRPAGNKGNGPASPARDSGASAAPEKNMKVITPDPKDEPQ